MKQRLISIAFMLPFVIFLFIGKLPLLLICFIISAFAMYEYYRGFEKLEIKASKSIAAALLIILYLIVYMTKYYSVNDELYSDLFGMWLFLSVTACMLLIIFDKNHNILGPTYTFLGVLYIAYMILHIALIEREIHAMSWMPIVIACLSDTGGYLGGMYFGKHKLAPILSPKKTVEGSIFGILFGTIGALLLGLIAFRSNLVDCIIMGVIGSALAETGDLVASAFKRKMGIKDYSNLIPGHGGIMDRIDSFIFVAPFVYYYIILFIN